jgi:uncharacterized protein
MSTSKHFTPLALAADRGAEETVRLLLEHGATVVAAGEDTDPLHLAVRAGHTKIAEMLLDHGADIEWVDSDGDTPLTEAALASNDGAVHLLLRRGANANAKNKKVYCLSILSSLY